MLLAVLLTSPALAQSDKAIAISPVRASDHVGESRYALIVGIDDYADDRIPDLSLCETDAKAVHAVLTDPNAGGVHPQNATLLLGEQASARAIKRGLNDLRRIPNDATVFVYFSGHGAKEAGESFWVTQDAELGDLAISALPDRDIRAFLDRIPSQRVVVMVDACYAAATVKEQKSVVDMASVLARFTGQGRAFLSAAGSGEEAIEAADLKHSVFTHYLVHGLRGHADTAKGGGNGDGVVVLPELTSYIDRHVAEQARVRGGIQKPVVDFDNVQEPAKFRLTIDADVIQRNLRENAESKALKATRLAALESLYLDEKLTRDQTQKGLALLRADPTTLDANDLKRLAYFRQVADGNLDPNRLQRALDLIETPEQRAVRLAEEARQRLRLEREAAARERQAKIADLLTSVVNSEQAGDSQAALSTLGDLLELEPNHAQAKHIYDQINQRLAREEEKRQRREQTLRITELLATAKANNSKSNGQTALRALDELLQLDPNNPEATQLQEAIRWYYKLPYAKSPFDTAEAQRLQEATATYLELPAKGPNSIGMELVLIPAGEFTMGNPDTRTKDNFQHRVRISKPFAMSATSVTRLQFEAFVKATGYQTDAERDRKGGWVTIGNEFKQSRRYNWRNPGFNQGDNHPVVNVSWNDATEFCRWLSQKERRLYRLPTESEWEYACRAGTTTAFSFGNTITTDQANYDGNYTYGEGVKGIYRSMTTPVRDFPSNPWGLYDMHGNASEWCGDWYGPYPTGLAIDSAGPASGDARLIRGGSWYDRPVFCTSMFRTRTAATHQSNALGFRIAMEID